MVTIKKQLAPEKAIQTRTFGRHNKRKSITIHETGNTSKGANAQVHANLQSNINPREASWNWEVDDLIAIQSFDNNVSCWAAGDGKGDGNMHSIHIEICVNSDGDYLKAAANAAELVQYLMKTENIPVSEVRQHNYWSGKNCPQNLRAGNKGIDWNGFIAMVKGDKDVEQVSKPAAPAKPSAPAPKPSVKNYWVRGDTGSTIGTIQKNLNKTGAKLAVDNSFGPAVERAVKAFQKKYGLTQDGSYGPATQAKMKQVLADLTKPAAKPKKEYVQLPGSATSWRLYPVSKSPVKGNEMATLNPAKFDGLEYAVLARPQANIVTIKTSQFGIGNIYVAASTGAKIIKK